jgi:uncharacterized protein YxjI
VRYLLNRKLARSDGSGDFVIRDESGRDAFIIDGNAVAASDKLSFKDLRRRELAYIRQRVQTCGPAYEIYYADELHAVVRKDAFRPVNGNGKSHLSSASFSIDHPGPDDLRAAGNFPEHEYTFTRDGRPVAYVSKAFLKPGDSYGIEILSKAEDEVLLLASTLVIDLCLQGGEREARAAKSLPGRRETNHRGANHREANHRETRDARVSRSR